MFKIIIARISMRFCLIFSFQYLSVFMIAISSDANPSSSHCQENNFRSSSIQGLVTDSCEATLEALIAEILFQKIN